jgi:hypothetical protein
MVPPSASGATTVTRPTLVHPTDITALRGLTVASSSVLVPGSAADTAIVATDTAPVIVAAATAIVAATVAATDVDTLAGVQSLAEAFMATLDPAEAVAAASTVVVAAVVPTAVVAADMVAVVTANLSTHI